MANNELSPSTTVHVSYNAFTRTFSKEFIFADASASADTEIVKIQR